MPDLEEQNMFSTPSPPQAVAGPTPRPRPFAVRSFGLSDRGRVRPSDEDRFLILDVPAPHVHQTNLRPPEAPPGGPRGYLFAVADGMAGHPAGEVASGLAVEALREFFLNSPTRSSRPQAGAESGALGELQGAFLQAHARVVEEAAQHPERRDLGTTLTAALAVDGKLSVAHAGHSRCYLFARGRLRQVTEDHTLAAELADCGVISPREVARHPFRHVVTNALEGKKPDVRVELHDCDLRPDDVVLLCSDGLTEMVAADRIAAILRAERESRRACERLVAEANEQGGKKNITVVVARIEGPGRQDEKR
jgi:protein phosphatase